MKKSVTLSVFLGILIALSICTSFAQTEQTLGESFVRLHIRANSNSPSDLNLKLKVRDRILKETGSLYTDVNTAKDAGSITRKNLEFIKRIAEDEIKLNGYNFPVSVSYGKSNFPLKAYGDIVLPPGTYNALVVEIGSGKGDNWWCVMFPPLCFVKESCKGIPAESKDMLVRNLGKENFDLISSGKPAVKFKIYEVWKKLKKD